MKPEQMDAELMAMVYDLGSPARLRMAKKFERWAAQLRASVGQKQQSEAFSPLEWLMDGCEKPLEDYKPKKAKAKKKPLPKWDMPKRLNLN